MINLPDHTTNRVVHTDSLMHLTARSRLQIHDYQIAPWLMQYDISPLVARHGAIRAVGFDVNVGGEDCWPFVCLLILCIL